MNVATVVTFSLALLYIGLFLVPEFAGIFRDMANPLPIMTTIVIRSRWVLVGVAGLCSLAAFFVGWRRESRGYLYALGAVLLLLITLTIIALFIPLMSVIEHYSS
jgi:type II secretory pathway component PulF